MRLALWTVPLGYDLRPEFLRIFNSDEGEDFDEFIPMVVEVKVEVTGDVTEALASKHFGEELFVFDF